MKVLIVGAGAVGGTYAVKSSRGGHEMGFVARGENGRAIRERGLVLEAPEGVLTARGPVFDSIEAAEGFAADVALVCVKWPALAEVAGGTGQALAPGGVAIPLLNGLGAEEQLALAIGRERVIGGVAQLAAERLGPGRVRLRAGGMMTLAPFTPDQQARVEQLAAEFSACFPCHADSDLARVRWQKLLWNAPFNAACALTRRRAGEVLAVPALEQLIRAVIEEVIAVANAEGVKLDAALIDAMLAVTRDVFADSAPSMLQDVLEGRETEAEQLQGAVVERGRLLQVPTPLTHALLALLRGLGSEGRRS